VAVPEGLSVTGARARAWRSVVLGAAAGALAGCSDDPPGDCQRDADCPAARLCVARGCVASLGAATAVWSLELVPPVESRFAPREHPDVPLTAAPASLAVDAEVAVTTILDRPDLEVVAGAAAVRVAFAVPSSIPGRRDLVFEGDSTSAGFMFPYDSQVALPQLLLGRQARMFVEPRAPVTRELCPWQFDVVLEPRQQLHLPGREDTLVIEGTLLSGDPGGAPPAEYEARVLLGERLASNLARTDAGGHFLVRMQLSAAMRVAGALRLELAAADSGGAHPNLVVAVPGGQASVDLGELRLPAHPAAAMVTVPVMDERQRPVAGATVSFETALAGAVGGEARYARSALTGSDGRVTLPLIPGAADRPAQYLVKVVPPASGEAAARCLPGYAVPEAPGARPLTGDPVTLPAKVALAGDVLRADGKPAAGLLVRATRQGDLIRAGCDGELASPPAEASSDGGGRYRMLLDPGNYRLDYEPPPDSPLPAASEADVPVTGATTRAFTLPEAVAVEGKVVPPPDDGGDPVARTEVRAYGPDAEGRTRVLASTTAGSDGRFRLVLPHR
jgi:hypothetical protein